LTGDALFFFDLLGLSTWRDWGTLVGGWRIHIPSARVAIRTDSAKVAPSTIALFDTRFDRRYCLHCSGLFKAHCHSGAWERRTLSRRTWNLQMNTNESLQKLFFGKFFQVRKYRILPETHTLRYRTTTVLLSWEIMKLEVCQMMFGRVRRIQMWSSNGCLISSRTSLEASVTELGGQQRALEIWTASLRKQLDDLLLSPEESEPKLRDLNIDLSTVRDSSWTHVIRMVLFRNCILSSLLNSLNFPTSEIEDWKKFAKHDYLMKILPLLQFLYCSYPTTFSEILVLLPFYLRSIGTRLFWFYVPSITKKNTPGR
jgi:hypothetical protein